jgi:hypothetical protein
MTAAAQTRAVVSVPLNIPADNYPPDRALVSDLDRIVTPNGVRESFILTPAARAGT